MVQTNHQTTKPQQTRKSGKLTVRIEQLAINLLLWPIKLYRLCISPLFGPRCRFHPTCSSYAIEAISTRGIAKGTLLSILRISKCRPGHPGGYDPVPLDTANNTNACHCNLQSKTDNNRP